jgi:putative SOS response-associated peptidase YedK
MCGRYRLTSVERIEEALEAEELEEFLTPRYNIAPSQKVPIVRQHGGRRTLGLARWGLVPFWARDPSVGLINARSETVLQKPSFRSSFMNRRRCLIPADGFYEWSKLQKVKRPFNLGMADNSLFAFAGLWDSWKSPEGEVVESCTIMTTTPNSLLADLHDRMPVIFPRRHYELWLAAPSSDAKRLTELLVPFEAELMRRYEISTFVNSPKNDTPDCIKPVAAE